MTLQILVLLLIVVLFASCIPIALYFLAERPAPVDRRSWFRSRQSVRPASSELLARVNHWYAGRPCVFCGQSVGRIHDEPRPGFLDREAHRTLGLQDLPEEELVASLDRLEPVCASCYTAESFRMRYPELVVDRASTSLRNNAVH